MKSTAFVLAALLVAAPAYAQLGGILNKAQTLKKKADEVKIDDAEERQIGEQVSKNLTDKYGVYQDAAVTKYVSLVGTVLAQASTRPGLAWRFVVLDTDGVNAFAAPGGIIHITRGLLGLIKSESELAGILGHEITHVTKKHTVRYIEQQKGITSGVDAVGRGGQADKVLAKMSERAYHVLLDGDFSRDDEREADRIGVQLASKVGYAPLGLAEALRKVDARNAGRDERNGLFASHPATKQRIDSIEKEVRDQKLPGTAVVQARYAKNITFDAKPIAEVTQVADGAAGLASGSGKAASSAGDAPKKKGGLLGKFTTSSGDQKQSSQTIASAGSRGGIPDRDATGGPNKRLVLVTVTPGEVAAFRAGIA
jgi:predicted Zn-dependent protease